MSYIFGKLWHFAIVWAIRKSFQCILQGVRFLLANQTQLSPTSDNDSYICGSILCGIVCVIRPEKNHLLDILCFICGSIIVSCLIFCFIFCFILCLIWCASYVAEYDQDIAAGLPLPGPSHVTTVSVDLLLLPLSMWNLSNLLHQSDSHKIFNFSWEKRLNRDILGQKFCCPAATAVDVLNQRYAMISSILWGLRTQSVQLISPKLKFCLEVFNKLRLIRREKERRGNHRVLPPLVYILNIYNVCKQMLPRTRSPFARYKIASPRFCLRLDTCQSQTASPPPLHTQLSPT